MATWTKDVFSSNVKQIGYDDEAGELIVYWTTGRVSAYSGVSPEKADEVAKTVSVGGMILSDIKPHHAHRYLK